MLYMGILLQPGQTCTQNCLFYLISCDFIWTLLLILTYHGKQKNAKQQIPQSEQQSQSPFDHSLVKIRSDCGGCV